MSGDIPLKIRVGIRDQWDSPNAPIRSSVNSLTKVLGHVVTPQVEWPTLYAALKDVFPDPSTFVPSICRIAIAFYGRLLSRLEREPETAWTENFLEEMSKTAHWKLRMEPGDDKGIERPLLVWNIDAGNFCIQVPKCKLAMNSVIETGFDEDLDAFFGSPKPQNIIEAPKSELSKEDDWADIGAAEETRGETLRVPPSHAYVPSPQVARARPVANKIEDLPSFDMVARPAKLFKSIAPYILTVNASGAVLYVQGSHSPSLEYLAKYLKKWARIDPSNTLKRPLLEVETVESAFFSDIVDLIVITGCQTDNPSLILGFVEGVLGYKETFTDGTRWIYKLDPESHSETSLVERNRKVI